MAARTSRRVREDNPATVITRLEVNSLYVSLLRFPWQVPCSAGQKALAQDTLELYKDRNGWHRKWAEAQSASRSGMRGSCV